MLNGGQIAHSRQTKTLFGTHSILLNAFMPRSCAGQIMKLKRMKKVPQMRPNNIVEKKAPTKPSTVFFGESLMSGVLPNVIPIVIMIS